MKWFNDQNGGGFIATDGGKESLSRPSAIEAEGLEGLQEGDPVSFGAEGGVRAPHAVRDEKASVRLMENPKTLEAYISWRESLRLFCL